MKRTLVGGAAIAVVGLVAVWFFWWRGAGAPAPEGAGGGSARSGKVEATPAATATTREAQVPHGRLPRWSLDPDKEGALQLEGQVRGPDGKGVGGAEVWLSSVPPRSAKTNDDGSFEFTRLVGRTYQLSAKSGDLIGGPVTYKLTDKSDPVVIRMFAGASVVVSVVDEAHRPIAGAEVRARELAESGQATTDAKGEATLKPVTPGYVGVTVAAPGYAPSGGFTTIGSPGAVARMTVVLRKGFPVSGRVIDDAGKPIGRAKVAVAGQAGWSGAAGDEDPSASFHVVVSDDKGEFTIRAVAAGTHRLTAVDGEHAPATSEPFAVGDRPVTGVTITMKAGGVIKGRVVDAAQQPAPFAAVRVAGTGQQLWTIASRQVTADAEGAFELRGLSRAKLQVRAESDRAASQLVPIDLTTKAEAQGVVLALDLVSVIAGKVVDEQGAPVAEVQVNAVPDLTTGGQSWEGYAIASMTTAMSGGGGDFEIVGLPEGGYRLSAGRSRGGFDFGEQGTPARTGDRNVVIKLPTPGGVKGTLVIEGSGPPKAALVSLGAQPATPAHDGAFELREVTPGTSDVTFRGAEFATLVKRDVQIEPGKVTDLGTVTVRRGRRLTGKVLDAKGQPIAGATVRLGDMLFSVEGSDDAAPGLEDMMGIRSTVTDAGGGFALVGLPPKETTVAAEHPDHGRSQAIEVPGGAQDPPPLTLALRGFGSITGKVTQKGAPLAGVTISQTTKAGGAQMAFAQTDDAGGFTLAKVIEGEHVLHAMLTNKPGALKSTSVDVKVAAGQQAKVAIEIPVGQLTLIVQPKAIAGKTIDAAQVFLLAGQVTATNGKQLQELFLGGRAQGMQLWFGGAAPAPKFEELLPGELSICTVPINGNLMDPTFGARLQQHSAQMKVYCKLVTLAAAPLEQTIVHEVPPMEPLPED